MKKHFPKSFALLAMLFITLTMSAGMELFNPATATLNKYYFAPNWVEDGISSASYNSATGTVSVDIQSQLSHYASSFPQGRPPAERGYNIFINP